MDYSRITKALHLFTTTVLVLGPLYVVSLQPTKILPTRAGIFKGTFRELDVFGETRTVEKYLGVPYAETPSRFQKPVIKAPLPPDYVYDATKYKPSCSQQEILLGGARKPGLTLETSEDCLFLNIYKPAVQNASTGLSVIVHFHGGGYVFGSPQFIPGDVVSTYGDVIFITVAYRLTAYGFLSTGDHILPGNLGLWDQHTALMWVHQYIGEFGGDPNSVAIMGHSAGSGSVIYHSLFAKNNGLFKRAIGLSGSPTGPWAFQPNPLDVTLHFARLLGCSTDTPTEKIIQCVKSKSTEEIQATLNKRENGFVKFPMDLVTVVDGEFVPSHPYRMINHETDLSPKAKEFFASIDFMTGITSGEGAMNIHPFVGVYNTFDFALTREQFERSAVPEAAKIMYGDRVPDVVVDMIIHKYTNWTDPEDTDSIRQSFLEMSGDYVFNFHAKLVADMHANLSAVTGKNTFAYYVEAFPSQHILEVPTWVSKPNHGDELTFLFGYDKEGYIASTTPYSEEYKPADWELETSKLYMTLFTNFAKTGDPNKPMTVEQMQGITWPKYNSQTGMFLAIERKMSQRSVRKNFCAESFDFWYKLIPEVIESPIPAGRGASYFKRDQQDTCDSDKSCSP